MTDDGRIRHKSITPMHQNAGTGTWVRRGSSWEEAHSEENTKRELLIDRPPKQFEHHFHPRAEGYVPAEERGNCSAADAALPPEPLSPSERSGSARGKDTVRV